MNGRKLKMHILISAQAGLLIPILEESPRSAVPFALSLQIKIYI